MVILTHNNRGRRNDPRTDGARHRPALDETLDDALRAMAEGIPDVVLTPAFGP
jgi:hypothetical protein